MASFKTFGIISAIGIALALAAASQEKEVKFLRPVPGKLTSPFGYRTHPVTGQKSSFHNGVDMSATTGTPIKAPADGYVVSKYKNDAGGNQLILKHYNGFTTGYSHLSAYAVNIGVHVKKGQIIGYVGATGRVTGPHLHFTMRDKTGELVDPAKFLA